MATHRTPTEFQRALGGRLREARKEKGLTANEVAHRLGCTQQNFEFLEMGYNRLTIERVFDIAQALEYEPRELASRLFHVDPDEDQSSDVERETESFELPAGASGKVDIGRVILRKLHPSQGPLVQLAAS